MDRQVTLIKKADPNSWNAPPPRVVAVADGEIAATYWIQEEVKKSEYAQDVDVSQWIAMGYFYLETVEVFDIDPSLYRDTSPVRPYPVGCEDCGEPAGSRCISGCPSQD